MENIFFGLFTSLNDLFFYILKAFYPLLFGLFFAYLLNDPVDWIQKKIYKNNNSDFLSQCPKGRGVSILVTYFLFFVSVSCIIFSFIYLIIGAIPSGVLVKTAEDLYEYFSGYIGFNSSEIKAATTSWFQKFFSLNSIINIISNASGFVINIFLGIVCSIYLLKDKAFFLMIWQKGLSLILGQKTHGIVNEILHDINLVLSTFIKGAAIDGVIIALISSIILTLLDVKFAVVIGIIGGILNVIPYFGPFLGMIPAFLVAITSQGLLKAIITVLALFFVQQLDSNYIYPKVVGASTGLHPLYILISVSIMGYFAGIIGMLLAVPIASIIQVIITKWLCRL